MIIFDFVLGALVGCLLSTVVAFCLPMVDHRYRKVIWEDVTT